MPFGPTHRAIRALASAAIASFYSDIDVVGAENVPETGPLLIVANHWAMTVDVCLGRPAMLSCNMPHRRMLHYWAKDSLFKNKYAKAILLDAGNIPVDRKNKDNQKLFAGTFDVLKQGEVVAVFPEGTSYTQPGTVAIKDGASWAALEYAKNLREQGATTSSGEKLADVEDVKIVVCGINYTDKTRYRSCAVLEFAPPIDARDYIDEFMQDSRAAVKRLSAKILEEMQRRTVTAPDWESLNAAIVARQLLWRYDSDIPLRSFRSVTQRLVDHFAATSSVGAPANLRRLLLDMHEALKAANLTSQSLGPAPLPRDLDPDRAVPLPSRLSSLFQLLKSTLASLIRLPFFSLPLIVHLPIYLAGRLTNPLLNSEEPESFAQNKIVLGLLVLVILYPTLWLFLWALLYMRPVGAVASFAFVWAFARYHNALVTPNYRRGRRLVTAWRILLAVWWPSFTPAGKSQENRMRRVLRLRGEASRSLHAHLIQLEQQGGKGAELVSRLRAAGAKLVSSEMSSTSAEDRVYVK